MSAFHRKYGTGTGADVYIPIIKRASVDYAVSADWTPAAGDVKVSKDGGAAANIGTLPTAVTMGNTAMWKFVFSDAELQCKTLAVFVADSATKAVEDQAFVVETFGHASAMWPTDWSVAHAQQTGDSYARIGANGAGLTSLAPASTALSTAQWTNVRAALLDNLDAAITTRLAAAGYTAPDNAGVTQLLADTASLLGRLTAARAGYLDNINVGGAVASQADISALNQSASRRIILTTVQQYERPESGTASYTIEARTYDGDGAAVNADSTPSLAVTGIVSGDLSANLSAASSPATGVYRWTYTVANDATIEQVRFDVSATLSAQAFTLTAYAQVVDLVSATWTTSDAAKLTAVYNKLPSKSYLTGTTNSDGDVQIDEATGTPADSAGVTTLLSRVGSNLFSGITALGNWLRAMVRKSSPDATALSEINSGGGTYDPTTDASESLKDSGVLMSDISTPALAKFATQDTGETTAADGSVAKISQGAAGGNVTVGDITQAALAKFATQDTGQTTAAAGSVAKLAQGAGGSVVLGPVTAQVSDQAIAASTGGVVQPIVVFQHSSATAVFVVVDGAGEPIDLTGHSIEFHIHDEDGETIAEIDGPGAQIVLSASDDEAPGILDQITVTRLPANHTLAGVFAYKLWDHDLNTVVATGRYEIRVAPRNE